MNARLTPELLKLSGMAMHGGQSCEHWMDLVGVDPRTVQGVRVTNGLCYWTPAAERACNAHWRCIRHDQAMLTGRLGV